MAEEEAAEEGDLSSGGGVLLTRGRPRLEADGISFSASRFDMFGD